MFNIFKKSNKKKERTCPRCGTTFSAVKDLGVCPNCKHSFHASKVRKKPVKPSLPHDQTLLLASVLSGDSPDVLRLVKLSIDDPHQLLMEGGKDYDFWDSGFDVDPLLVAQYTLADHDYVGVIDWRSEPNELPGAAEPLLQRHGITDFDWSFIDELEESEDVEMGKSENFLNLATEKVAERELVMIHLSTGSDTYFFAIVTLEDFDKIARIKGKGVRIRDRF